MNQRSFTLTGPPAYRSEPDALQLQKQWVWSWSRYLEPPPSLKITSPAPTPSSGCGAAVCRSRRPQRAAQHSRSLCNWSPFSAAQVNVGKVKSGATSRGTTPSLPSSLLAGIMLTLWREEYLQGGNQDMVSAVVRWWRWMLNNYVFHICFASWRSSLAPLKNPKAFYYFLFFSVLVASSSRFFFFFLSSPLKRIMLSAVRNLQNYLVRPRMLSRLSQPTSVVYGVDINTKSQTPGRDHKDPRYGRNLITVRIGSDGRHACCLLSSVHVVASSLSSYT